MMHENASDETVVVAVYSNWNEAEIARSFLGDEGIEALITGQEPHRGPELTDGMRLRVLGGQAERAHTLLAEHNLLPAALDPKDIEEHVTAYRRLTGSFIFVVGALIVFAILLNAC